MSTNPIDGSATVAAQSVDALAHPHCAANSSSSDALRPHTVCITAVGSVSKKRPTLSHALECARPMNFEPMRAILIGALTRELLSRRSCVHSEILLLQC